MEKEKVTIYNVIYACNHCGEEIINFKREMTDIKPNLYAFVGQACDTCQSKLQEKIKVEQLETLVKTSGIIQSIEVLHEEKDQGEIAVWIFDSLYRWESDISKVEDYFKFREDTGFYVKDEYEVTLKHLIVKVSPTATFKY